jgi:HSP20 family protein
MSLSPFERRGGFYDAHSEVNRLLDEMFGGLGRRPASRGAQASAEWAPSVDVLQKDGDLVVRVEMPGVKPEDIDITLVNDVLTISGERKAEQEEEHGDYYIIERPYGSFRRSFTLPQDTDESKIRARFENGILEVTVQGAAVLTEPKPIQIEGASDQESKIAEVPEVQIKNPRTGLYLKIDRSAGKILEHKTDEGPYEDVPIAGEK